MIKLRTLASLLVESFMFQKRAPISALKDMSIFYQDSFGEKMINREEI